ncbi:MAG: OmpA family protein [Myxococcota bacterium]
MTRALLLLAASGCVAPLTIRDQATRTQETLDQAYAVYGPLCAPREMALAQANLDFTRIELSQGRVRRAADHAAVAEHEAAEALRFSQPCGGVDADRDTIPDIVDACPNEREDFDGDADTDGCRDVDPYGDQDGDGVINVDDGCVDQPEDFDGDADDDGCPETSEDTDGDSIIDLVDQCVTAAEDLDGFQDADGCPEPDNDEDGIGDIVDDCPNVAEDLDGWDDEDGCPDPDNDGDGVPDQYDDCPTVPGDRDRRGCPLIDADKDGVADADDRCPDAPETRNGYLDEDGCPDQAPTGVQVTRQQVKLTGDTVQFESGSATLLPSSHAVLDKLVQVLQDAPYLKLRIEGHTDNEAGEALNLALSRDRAQAVRRYLQDHGIDPARLESEGYGETRPIDTNRTPNGRARNRRVEFRIVRPE